MEFGKDKAKKAKNNKDVIDSIEQDQENLKKQEMYKEIESIRDEEAREEEEINKEFKEEAESVKVDRDFDEEENIEEIKEEEKKEEKELGEELVAEGELKPSEDYETLEDAEKDADKFEEFYEFKKKEKEGK